MKGSLFLLLNRNNCVIKQITVYNEGIAGTIVDPKLVFKHALDHLASCIILSHNHPSGNLKPSSPDIELTKKLVAAGNHLDIKVLVHIIVSSQGYYSFLDEGLIS